MSCGCLRRELTSDMCKKRTGSNHPSWKGGTWIDKNGYRMVKCDHPRASKGYLLEHTLVMEKHLNRYLVKGETVHHRNGIRNDNRIENLELKIGNHGHGITLEDHKQYIMEQVRLYLPEIGGVLL